MKRQQRNRVGLIPARGGSKSIPRKNIKPLLGRPLIYWTCLAASRAQSLQKTYVSTEDEEIRRVVESFGLPKIEVISRAGSTATDEASTESVMLDFASRVDFDVVCLLQATSPLTTTADIDRAVARFETEEFDSVLSVVRTHKFFWETDSEGVAQALNYNPQARPRRQDWSGVLQENGAIYLTSRTVLLDHESRLGNRVGVVEMCPETAMELDVPSDWLFVERLMLLRSKSNLAHSAREIKLVLSDVDGCLTDSGMYYSETGDELKKFNTRDGKAFELLRKAGMLVGIVTSEKRELNTRRFTKLMVDELHQGIKDKVSCVDEILSKYELEWHQVAYLGDDLNDVEVLRRVGLSATPSDAVEEAQAVSTVVLKRRGGGGALREFASLILGTTALNLSE